MGPLAVYSIGPGNNMKGHGTDLAANTKTELLHAKQLMIMGETHKLLH